MPVSQNRKKRESRKYLIFLFTVIHKPGYEQRHPAQTALINRIMKQMTNSANNTDL